MGQLVRRTHDDYAQILLDLVPPGDPYPREHDTTLFKVLVGLAGLSERLDSRVADLVEREADPRATIEMLAEWERNAGLPDPCVDEPLSIGERRKALVARLTAQGRQDRAYFLKIAADLGYEIAEIIEWSPFMVGVSRVGDTRPLVDGQPGRYRWEVGSPDMRFFWKVRVTGKRVTWFRVGQSQTGVDPHARIARATDLECLFQRYKPAHTKVVFDYSEAEPL